MRWISFGPTLKVLTDIYVFTLHILKKNRKKRKIYFRDGSIDISFNVMY